MATRSMASSSTTSFTSNTAGYNRGSVHSVFQNQKTARVKLKSLRRSPLFGSARRVCPHQHQDLETAKTCLLSEPKSFTYRCLREIENIQRPTVANDRSMRRGRGQEQGRRGGETGKASLRQSVRGSFNSLWKATTNRVSIRGMFLAAAEVAGMGGLTAETSQEEGGEMGERKVEEWDSDADNSQTQISYDWRAEWYPVYCSKDFPSDKPVAVTLFDKPLVLYRDDKGMVRCVEDMCPHRLAKLSEGQVLNGRIECLYHGWQFEGESGKCVHIPQLAQGAAIPRAACLKVYPVVEKAGYILVYLTPMADLLGGKEKSESKGGGDASSSGSEDLLEKALQKVPDWLQPASLMVHDDLPYDHSFLLENILDPAHVQISHHATPGGGNRDSARPLLMRVIERSDRGFKGFYPHQNRRQPDKPLVCEMEFVAPCHVITTFRSSAAEGDVEKGDSNILQLVLISCTPLGIGKSRLFFTTTRSNFLLQTLPRWFFHLNSLMILEQDMGLVQTQETYVRALLKDRPLSRVYLPLQTSDLYVVEYRKWLDKVGHGLPYYEGYRTAKLADEVSPAVHNKQMPSNLPQAMAASSAVQGNTGSIHSPSLTNRYWRHVVNCSSCLRALKNFRKLRNVCVILSVLTGVLALALGPAKQRAIVALLCAFMISAAYAVQTQLIARFQTNWLRPHKR
ncbi:hypothetical protein CBR_g3534 [Chara braunii]|uniref:Rieske domain-containing protein n=1 Tax=Chara braunii TaxID=69332 RepID=A0A388KFK8_CHABU|nr:hypothetical protein CBR_g3534 [Chara braunii]|eukprot:GBG68840.1 hypothetical protein CBR_g3534 [Chara braunii]